jgi:hypothetical protein
MPSRVRAIDAVGDGDDWLAPGEVACVLVDGRSRDARRRRPSPSRSRSARRVELADDRVAPLRRAPGSACGGACRSVRRIARDPAGAAERQADDDGAARDTGESLDAVWRAFAFAAQAVVSTS